MVKKKIGSNNTNPLKFSELVTGTLNSSIHANLSSGQYLVLYKSGTSPYYYTCTCTDANSNHRCDNALYIPCDEKNCTFNTLYNGKTAVKLLFFFKLFNCLIVVLE